MTAPDDAITLAPATRQPPVFQVRGVTKLYRMGEVEVQALRGVDLDRVAPQSQNTLHGYCQGGR